MNDNMTKDTLRLRSEIVTLRDRRLEAIRQDVGQLLASFGKARADISQQTRAMLTASVTELRQSVLELRHLFQVDLIGARQAWRGVGPKPRGKPMPFESNVIAAGDDTVPRTAPMKKPVSTDPAPKAKKRSGKIDRATASGGKSKFLVQPKRQPKKQLAKPFRGRVSK